MQHQGRACRIWQWNVGRVSVSYTVICRHEVIEFCRSRYLMSAMLEKFIVRLTRLNCLAVYVDSSETVKLRSYEAHREIVVAVRSAFKQNTAIQWLIIVEKFQYLRRRKWVKKNGCVVTQLEVQVDGSVDENVWVVCSMNHIKCEVECVCGGEWQPHKEAVYGKRTDIVYYL
jgi:hypothetical protein